MAALTPGWIDSRLAVIGTADIPLYVMVNEEAATLIEGGISGMTELVWRQLNDLLEPFGGIRHLRYWLITHSHYDHCSLLTTLKPRMPWVQVWGSLETAGVFERPSACKAIRRFDTEISACWEPFVDGEFENLADIPLHPMKPGATLDIGSDMKVQAVALPGHSPCQFGYQCPNLDLLFVSDALGEYHREGEWLPLVFDDLSAYRSSLDAIEARQVSRLALGHHAIIDGQEARHAVRQARHGLAALEQQALTVRGDEFATHSLALEWTDRYALRSEKVVPRSLHLKSMARMIDLFQRQLNPVNA
jgi:glyoxylase-like metal-dependent hydrolase (beta-lactamase superfamily II)